MRALLGEGGFGVVYDVWYRERRERVALEALHRVAADALRRFEREFRTLVDLRRPNLIRLHELKGLRPSRHDPALAPGVRHR